MERRATKRASSIAGVAALALGLGLSACGNPYGLNLNSINFDAKQQPGVIQFSDPKLYKRATLLNERRAERGFIETLLKRSEAENFKFEPQIVRELEVIQSIAASAGLKFDPAAGANFTRQTETAELQQKIEVTRLEMQLRQLQRDAELLQRQLDAQTAANAVAAPAAGGPAAVTSPVTAPELTALITQIGDLRKSLETRLDAGTKPPSKSGGVAGPIDAFADLSAYRGVLNSARNAVSLDELHDKDGNSLFRLQLRATVLPGQKGSLDTLGVLRMEFVAPRFDNDDDIRGLYLEWLLHVNRSLNLAPDSRLPAKDQRIRTSADLRTLANVGGYFDIIMIALPKTPAARAICKGVTSEESRPGDCWYVRIAAPRSGAGRDFVDHLDYSLRFPIANTQRLHGASLAIGSGKGFQAQPLAPDTFTLDTSCRRFPDRPVVLGRPDDPRLEGLGPQHALNLAMTAHTWWPYHAAVLGLLSEVSFSTSDGVDSIALLLSREIEPLRQVSDAANQFLGVVAEANPRCFEELLAAKSVAVPPQFKERIRTARDDSRITVYDVVPSERVQQISTAARAAEAVSLAAAIAGQLPTYGLGLNGNFAYSRAATGKADAIERAPLVVGFAEPAQMTDRRQAYPAFGWLLGPQVSVDPENQALVLTQRLKPYDLSADLSLPGWWPYFELKSYTAWAPNWRDASKGTTADVEPAALSRVLRVPLAHNAADMDGLSSLLLARVTGQRVAYPSIMSIEPPAISACAKDVQFQIRGDNIWRATLVHVGGLAVDESSIAVLPDMRGVLIRLKAMDIPRIGNGANMVTVWTPDGPASFPLYFDDKRKNGVCQAEQAPPPASKDPQISSVAPAAISACDDSAVLTVVGKNLGGATSAVLGTTPTMTPTELQPGTGTSLEIKVPGIVRSKKFAGMESVTLAVRTTNGVATTNIVVKQWNCS